MAKTKNRGAANGNAKLTDKKVIKIRSLKGKHSQNKLATRFGVSIGLIGAIQRREVWKHLRQPRAA